MVVAAAAAAAAGCWLLLFVVVCCFVALRSFDGESVLFFARNDDVFSSTSVFVFAR